MNLEPAPQDTAVDQPPDPAAAKRAARQARRLSVAGYGLTMTAGGAVSTALCTVLLLCDRFCMLEATLVLVAGIIVYYLWRRGYLRPRGPRVNISPDGRLALRGPGAIAGIEQPWPPTAPLEVRHPNEPPSERGTRKKSLVSAMLAKHRTPLPKLTRYQKWRLLFSLMLLVTVMPLVVLAVVEKWEIPTRATLFFVAFAVFSGYIEFAILLRQWEDCLIALVLVGFAIATVWIAPWAGDTSPGWLIFNLTLSISWTFSGLIKHLRWCRWVRSLPPEADTSAAGEAKP